MQNFRKESKMKKFAMLMIGALACSLTACGDGDDKKTIDDCRPGVYVQAKAINEAMAAAGSEATAEVCEKKGQALSDYIDKNGDAIKTAGTEYKKYADKGSWDSVSDVLCTAYSAVLLTDAYAQLKAVNKQIEDCTKIIASATEDQQSVWNKAVTGLTSVEGWEAALGAAIESGNKSNSSSSN